MRMQDLLNRLPLAGMVAIGLLCAAVAPLAAQQAQHLAPAAQVSAAEASAPTPSATTPSATLPGPRASAPRFQLEGPIVPQSDALPNSAPVPAGGHTIVISTLALVLAVIIITVLVVK